MNKKLLFIFLIVISIIFGAQSSVFAANVPSFEITPNSRQLNNTCTTNMQVMISTAGKVSNAADIIIRYDAAKLEIIDGDPLLPGVQIIPGNAYDVYVGNVVDPTTGTIKLTAFNSDLAERALFAEIPLRAKVSSGSTAMNISFLGHSYLNTKDSNIAETGSSNDILEEVTNATITFGDGPCDKDVAPPQVSFSHPKNLDVSIQGNTVTFYVSDNGLGVDINTIRVSVDGVEYTINSPELKYTGNAGSYQIILTLKDNFKVEKQSSVVASVKDFAGNTGVDSVTFNVSPPSSAEKCVYAGSLTAKLLSEFFQGSLGTAAHTPERTDDCIYQGGFFEQLLNEFLKDSSIFVNILGPLSVVFLFTIFTMATINRAGTFIVYSYKTIWGAARKSSPIIEMYNTNTNKKVSGLRVTFISKAGHFLGMGISDLYGKVYADIKEPFLVRLDTSAYIIEENNLVTPGKGKVTQVKLISVDAKRRDVLRAIVLAVCISSFTFTVANLYVFFSRGSQAAFLFAVHTGFVFAYTLSKLSFTYFIKSKRVE